MRYGQGSFLLRLIVCLETNGLTNFANVARKSQAYVNSSAIMELLKWSRRRQSCPPSSYFCQQQPRLLFIGSGVFEANATTNVWAESLSAQAKTYSPLGKASCTGKGLFCQSGSILQCKPSCVCVPCSSTAPVRVKHYKHKS